MSNAIFPWKQGPAGSQIRGLTFNKIRTIEEDTLLSRAVNGYTTSIAQLQNPLWHWEFIYDFLWDNPANIISGNLYTDLRLLEGFYLQRNGRADDFLYEDPDDYQVVNQTMQLVQDGDGTWWTPIQRNLGGFFEDVTDLNGALALEANGVPQSSGSTCTGGTNYVIQGPGVGVPGFSWMGLAAQWCAEPTAPITGTFDFYFRVRFETDRQAFEKFMRYLWTIGGSNSQGGAASLKIMSKRRNPI